MYQALSQTLIAQLSAIIKDVAKLNFRLVCLMICLLQLPLSSTFAQLSTSEIEAQIALSEERRLAGQLPEAIEILKTTLGQALEDRDSTDQSLGELYHKMGVNFYRLGDLNQASKHTNLALRIRTAAAERNNAQIGRGYFLLGAIQRGLGTLTAAKNSVNQAIIAMETSLEENPNGADSLRLANMYVEYTRINWTLGDFSTAHRYLDKAFDFFIPKFGQIHYEVAGLHKLRGILFDEEKKHSQAQAEFFKSIDIYEKLDGDPVAEMAGSYTNLALSHFNSKQNKEAIRYFKKAEQLFQRAYRQNPYPYFLEELANVNACLVRIYGQLRNREATRQNFQEGLRHLQSIHNSPYHPLFAEMYRHKGAADLVLGNEQEALKNFQTAIKSLLPEYKPEDVNENPVITNHIIGNKRELLEILHLKADALLQQYQKTEALADLQSAYQTFRIADTLITQIRRSFNAAGSRYVLMDKVLPIYEQAIGAAFQLFELTQESLYLEQAYTFMAKNKALVLLEGLQDEQAKQYAGIPKALLATERRLRKQSYDLTTKIYELQQNGITETLPALRDSLFKVQRQYTLLIEQFEADYPAYYALKYQYARPIDINNIQSELSEDGLLLEYFIGENTIFLVALARDYFRYYTIDKPGNFLETCLEFRKASDSSEPIDKEQYLDLGFRIYDWLLSQALREAEEQAQIKRLTIIPDDILLYISFEPLLYEQAVSWDRINNPYLLKKYAINYAYSNQLLFDRSKTERINQALKGFGGFGLEYDDYTLEGIEKLVKTDTEEETLKRATGKLIYSDDEVREIAALLRGQSWLNQEATKTAFIDNAASFQILHMAMHGVVYEKNPLNSALIFTRTSDTADYFLRAADLYGIPLNADLAVLSACNTGYGEINRGEGIRSLARAFAYAGCPSLIASLWEASDKSSKDILLAFYKKLQSGIPKDQALQQAKLEYLQNTAPAFSGPAYWSHLVLIGDPGVVKLNSGKGFPWIILLVLLLTAGLLLAIRFKT